MNRKRSLWLLLAALLFGGLLASCGDGTSRIEIGMREIHLSGDWQANYATFTGRKSDTFQADAGQRLDLEYKTQVDRGTLKILVENPADEVVWQVSLQEGQSDSVQVPLEQDGRYTMRIVGEGTSGSWHLQWNIQ